MSFTDAIGTTDMMTRINQIQSQLAALQDAFDPAAATAASSGTASANNATAATAGSGTMSTNFATALAQAQGATGASSLSATGGLAGLSGLTGTAGTTSTFPVAGGLPNTTGLTTSATGGAATLPSGAMSMLNSDQQQFASRLAAETGLDPGVISAWVLGEESGSAASSRSSAGNNDWLNIGYTDSATYGAADSIWNNPLSAADATAGWIKGQDTIPGYGTASSGIQGILNTVGQGAAAQISAIQNSGWASGGYPELSQLYQQVAG